MWKRLVSFIRRSLLKEDAQNLEEEIQSLIDEGEQKGLLTEDEGEMIQSIFSFRDTVAREIMVPRIDAVCISNTVAPREVIDLIVEKGHSRIPIYEGDIDNIIGIVHAKDLLPFWSEETFNWTTVLRPPYFVPETKKISEILGDLRNKKSHMAVVIDEYGGTAGILTMEDIIEEIIGEIQDEYDLEESRLVMVDEDTVMVDARLDVEDLEEHFNIDIPEGKFETVGGFIINMLGRLPDVQEHLVFNNLEMTIEDADNRKIQKVRIKKLSESEMARMIAE